METNSQSDSKRLLLVMLVIVLVLIFAAGIYYFITNRSSEGDAALQTKIASLEGKVANLEKQVSDLQGKLGTAGPDPSFAHRIEVLSQKVEALEKKAQVTTEAKGKPVQPEASRKRYHTVLKGETLSQISK